MGADATLLLLDKNAVEQLLTPPEVTQAVREAFLLHSEREGRVFPVVRETFPPVAFSASSRATCSRRACSASRPRASGPQPKAGGEPHQATILLFDPATGRPLA